MATKRFRTISVFSNGDPSIGDPGHFITINLGEEIEWSEELEDWIQETQWKEDLATVFGAMFDDRFQVRFNVQEPEDMADNEPSRS